MSWEKTLKKKLQNLQDPNNPGKDLPDPRGKINTHLVLNNFLPKSGWYKEDKHPSVSFTIENTGNAPSYSAVLAIYAGRSDMKLSEFKCISTTTFTLYPGEQKRKEINIENKKLPSSGPTLFLPGSSKPLLVAVCFDPFLMPVDKSQNIGVDTITAKDYIAGGVYQNNLIRIFDGAILFGYKEIK